MNKNNEQNGKEEKTKSEEMDKIIAMIDEQEELEEANIVELIDEKGETVHFDHLLTFDYENKFFIALMPMDSVEGIGEDEVLILEIKTDENGEDSYVALDDEKMLEAAFERFLDLFDTIDDDIDEQDEE